MEWHLTALADVAATPWRNGGGITRELAVWPPQGDWQWRMSVAEVTADGPFSRFEGAQRWFAVLQGAGVTLDIAGERHRLIADSAPLQFDGAAPTECRLLAGSTQDFNLMVRAPRLLECSKPNAALMLRITAPTRIVVDAPKVIAVWAIDTWSTALFDSQSIKIPPETLAWRHFEQSGILTLHSENALWMEIPICTKKR